MQEYRAIVRDYLSGDGETALRRAYELGRRWLIENRGLLEIMEEHRRCMLEDLDDPSGVVPSLDVLAESLSAFEMVMRGYQEAQTTLRRNLSALLEAETQLQHQNQKLSVAHRAVDAERRRYREMFEFAPDAYLETSLDGTIREANAAAADLLRTRGTLLDGQKLVHFLAEEDQAEVAGELARFREGSTEKRDEWQVRLQVGEGITIPAAITVAHECDANGGSPGLRWLLRDVTARKRAEEARAQSLVGMVEEQAARRFAFLAEVSAILGSSLHYESTLGAVARLAVPYLADWCVFQVVENNETIRRIGAAFNDAGTARAVLLDEMVGPRTGNIVDAGEAEIADSIDESWLDMLAGGRKSTTSMAEIGFRSMMRVPLRIHDRVLGVLLLANAQPGRAYTGRDLALAEDIARRCALAIENARLYREVIAERDRAETASRAKDQFLAMLSHELRGPLTPVVGWTRILREHPAIAQDLVLQEGAGALERNARHLQRLVGDCLDLSRISRGQIQMEKEIIDINRVMEASLDAIRPDAEKKRLSITANLYNEPLWVWGDATRLQQVTLNLLDNAVKYTEPGGQIQVCSGQSSGRVHIEVQDTGIGVAAEDREQIFQTFIRTQSAWASSESGLGLGLSIVRQIVEMHEGTVVCESDGPGLGSTFRVELPLSVETATTRSPDAKPPATSQEAGSLRILVVEDAADIAFLLRVELEGLGYNVITQPDGNAGLAAALDSVPDVIISDIKMPGMDGYEFISRVRSTPALAAIPAVALTGFGMAADARRAASAGYDASLTKPADPQKLDALIRRLTRRQAPFAGAKTAS